MKKRKPPTSDRPRLPPQGIGSRKLPPIEKLPEDISHNQYGNSFKNIASGITMMQFTPDYRDTMDKALEQYDEFKKEMKVQPTDQVYSFAYWLFRYSGLIRPSNQNDNYI